MLLFEEEGSALVVGAPAPTPKASILLLLLLPLPEAVALVPSLGPRLDFAQRRPHALQSVFGP